MEANRSMREMSSRACERDESMEYVSHKSRIPSFKNCSHITIKHEDSNEKMSCGLGMEIFVDTESTLLVDRQIQRQDDDAVIVPWDSSHEERTSRVTNESVRWKV
jgi:hypothetical protein